MRPSDHLEHEAVRPSDHLELEAVMRARLLPGESRLDEDAMRYPSLKTLRRLPNISEDDARKIRWILARAKRHEITASSEAARKYENSCYNPPEKYLLKLCAIDEILRTHGVESIILPESAQYSCARYDVAIDYLNTGDPYDGTLLRVDNRRRGTVSYRVGCWGGIVEQYDRIHPIRD